MEGRQSDFQEGTPQISILNMRLMSDIDQKEKGCSPQEMSSMTKETSREPPAAIHTDRELEYER